MISLQAKNALLATLAMAVAVPCVSQVVASAAVG